MRYSRSTLKCPRLDHSACPICQTPNAVDYFANPLQVVKKKLAPWPFFPSIWVIGGGPKKLLTEKIREIAAQVSEINCNIFRYLRHILTEQQQPDYGKQDQL